MAEQRAAADAGLRPARLTARVRRLRDCLVDSTSEGPGSDRADRGRRMAGSSDEGQSSTVPTPREAWYRDGGRQAGSRCSSWNTQQRAEAGRPQEVGEGACSIL